MQEHGGGIRSGSGVEGGEIHGVFGFLQTFCGYNAYGKHI